MSARRSSEERYVAYVRWLGHVEDSDEPSGRTPRRPWVFALLAFPAVALLSLAITSCLCAVGPATFKAMLAANILIGVRLVVGMVRREQKRVMYVYLALPIILAIAIQEIGHRWGFGLTT